MTDLYKHELQIPQKSRTLGWGVILSGSAMVVLAGTLYLYHSKRPTLPEGSPTVTSQPARTADEASSRIETARQAARPLVWVTLVAVGLLFVFVLLAGISHRMAKRFRTMTEQRRPKTTYRDPWQESAKRLETPPEDES
jgi:hypothetical protein